MDWPDGKSFAFTVFDDTDNATLANVSEVYRLLADLGIKTAKSVWPSRAANADPATGSTCEDSEYVEWLQRLRESGFEIGYHMNACRTSTREETKLGLARFEVLFGGSPVTMANHSRCEENIYWGTERVSSWRRLVYDATTGFRNRGKYRGHIEGDPLFWGDICHEKIRYCRSFQYPEIDTLSVCPFMPYHDRKRPLVNYWFASAEAPDISSYTSLLSEKNQESLEESGGACVVYTHFASGFVQEGGLDSRFRKLMTRLAQRNGWFVPTGTLLDYLLESNGHHEISDRERRSLEWKWLRHKLKSGTT
jgi:hypothetical protein